MTSTLTDSTLVLANRFFDILDQNKAIVGLEDVWFGDQQLIPKTPTLCVEPGIKRRDLQGVPDMTRMTIDTNFLIYHSPVRETQTARRECIDVAEQVERFLNENYLRLESAEGNQLIIHGFVTLFDPGYAYKLGTLHSSVLMTWTSQVKVSLRRSQI